jgi:hypothetical protein
LNVAADARELAMNTGSFAPILHTLLGELVHGSPDPGARTYVLNRGDDGLLASLDRLSAASASTRPDGGASIAAHADHLRYGLSLLNRWAGGSPPPWPDMDWTASWKKNSVSDDEWKELRDALRREADAWAKVVGSPRELSEVEAGWTAGSVVHVAYHLGAIRQIDRAARGPSAEDEAKAEAQQRGSANR